MNRLDMISRLRSESFDVAIIGGGATGLGIAVDSASRGYRTALLEAHDFAKATSSRIPSLFMVVCAILSNLTFACHRGTS